MIGRVIFAGLAATLPGIEAETPMINKTPLSLNAGSNLVQKQKHFYFKNKTPKFEEEKKLRLQNSTDWSNRINSN